MNYGMSYSGGGGFVADYSQDVRAEFIRKVYSLFFGSLLVTCLVGWYAAMNAATVLGFWPILAIAGFVCIIALSFAGRVPGLNLALFVLYSAIQGAILGPLLALYEARYPGLATTAGWITMAVFGGLTAYVFTTKKDFSFLGGMLFVALIALIVAGIVMFFVHAAWLSVVYCVLGILIFSGYVLYDTSRIMHHLRPEDAVFGAVSLYLDFVNLFMLILRLLSSQRN
jgi:FtsH-binding integral membrane protein